ncbi:NAD-dependent epimerase/dehydratase family protein [Actinophytocola sp.]|uniref:NAD-dependent epimerase/dehydratase family protein n=1 Tax=Actinophytocola sp. TaxID=1872138 RepID=UPI002ED6719B
MRVVITGGAGFIGANLCRALAARHEVRVLDDLSTGSADNLAGVDVAVQLGSVLDADAVREVCEGAAAIVHLAAVPSVPRSIENPKRSHDVNVTGTLTVLEVAREVGAHVVTASSSSVYGDGATAKAEDVVCRPASPYAVSKLAAEAYTSAYRTSFALDAVSFRFFNVFGPLQAANHAYAAVIPAFLHAALHDVPLTVHGDGEQSRDFTHVDSVVSVLTDAVERRLTHPTAVNLAFGTRTTLNELVTMLGELLGRRLAVEHRPSRLGDIRHSRAYPATLRELFPDVRPVPVRVGLARTLSWMRTQSEALAAESRVTV